MLYNIRPSVLTLEHAQGINFSIQPFLLKLPFACRKKSSWGCYSMCVYIYIYISVTSLGGWFSVRNIKIIPRFILYVYIYIYSNKDPPKPAPNQWVLFVFQCFLLFLIFVVFCPSFAFSLCFSDILKPESYPPSEVTRIWIYIYIYTHICNVCMYVCLYVCMYVCGGVSVFQLCLTLLSFLFLFRKISVFLQKEEDKIRKKGRTIGSIFDSKKANIGPMFDSSAYINIYIYICICICMYVCMSVYIYICVCVWGQCVCLSVAGASTAPSSTGVTAVAISQLTILIHRHHECMPCLQPLRHAPLGPSRLPS